MGANTASSEQNRQSVDLLGQLSTLALGAAGGLAINTASPDVGYRGAAGALLVGMVISTIRWIRRLPQGAPLVKYSPAVLLSLTLCCAVLTLVSPGSWATTLVMVGVGLATIAVLIPTDRELTWRLLRGVAVIAVGVAFIGGGIAILRADDTVLGMGIIGIGVAFISGGIAILRGGDTVLALADIGVGVAFIGGGIAGLPGGKTLLGMAGALIGVGIIGIGIATLRGSGTLFRMTGRRDGGNTLLGMAGTLFGAGIIGIGTATLRGDGTLLAIAGMGTSTLLGMACVGAGVAIIGVGIASLHGGRTLFGMALIGFGVAGIGFGIPILHGGGTLLGLACVAIGVAAVGVGGTTLGCAGVWEQWGSWAIALTREPASLNPTPNTERLTSASPSGAGSASGEECD